MSVTNIVSGLKSLLSGTSVPRWSWAAGALAVTLMVGLWIGRVTAPTPEPYFLTPNAGNRVLGAQLTRHLESTERTLLMAAHGRGDPELAAELADALLESHRLYAQAAERAGQGELALFLRELEPVLLQLANADTLGGPNAVREAIIRRDLPFKIRAVTAATRRDLGGSTPEWL